MDEAAKTFVDHAFLDWCVRLEIYDALISSATDVFLKEAGAARFGVSWDEEDGLPILGVVQPDVEAIQSVPWGSAALFPRHKLRSWVILGCEDVFPQNDKYEPTILRLWIPVIYQVTERWAKSGAKLLRVHELDRRSDERFETGKHLLTLPLQQAGVEEQRKIMRRPQMSRG